MISRIMSAVLFALALHAVPARAQEDKSFKAFLDQLWIDAKAKDIKRSTFDLAFKDITLDPRVMPVTKKQPEYITPAGKYVGSLASANNASAGLKKEQEWHKTFDAIDKAYGVERWLILAIWGVETSFGKDRDKWDVVRSLATLAHAKYRDPYFRNELLVSLKILQEGHIARSAFVGSWSGAMGQTQFMPTNFMDYAVDFSGDGRRDIWTNVPDVLASTANYMKKEGWTPGMPWGFEVSVPKGFDYSQSRGTFAEWKERGIKRTDGGAFPATGDGILFFPTGSIGPAFLVTKNFDVIKLYNNSDVYALAIGLLSDRMHGGGIVRATWPEQATQPSREDRIALQQKLKSLGYKVRNVTGHMDFDLRDAIRQEQVKLGMLPDGHPSQEFLRKMGAKA